MMCKRVVIALATVWIGLGTGRSSALADGGTMRFSGRRGDRVVTVFTAPAPLSAGLIDLSVLVQDSKTGRAISDLAIEVHSRPIGFGEMNIRAVATTGAATNKLMRAASFELPEPGRWHIDVFVQSLADDQPIGFDVAVTQPPPHWLKMSLWIAWPLLPIGLFGIREVLRMRSGRHVRDRIHQP